jgi:predicted O-methyltransferase YrrM
MPYKLGTVIAWLALKMKWLSELNRYRLNMKSRLGIVYTAPTHLSTAERLFLYSLVRGTMPERALEIGTAQGGSAGIIAAAMEDNGTGTLIGIDPDPRVDCSLPSYYGRFKLLECAAPKGIGEAAHVAGGKFDLVFYDGPNVHSAAGDIVSAIIPHLAERAYLVIDNALHYGLHQTIIDAVDAESRFHDCGFVCVKLSVHDRNVAYGGLRLVRFESNNVSDPQPIIDREYRAAGLPVPAYDLEVLNHGGWWCREVRACPRCAREAASASSITSSGPSAG